MSQHASERPHTLGELRSSAFPENRLAHRTVKDELRSNLICKLRRREKLFPGIVGYEDTVVPQLVNAILSRHNFILLGLRGQAKTRLIRMLTTLLDPWTPYVAGCEIHDNPYVPICRRCQLLVAEKRRRHADRIFLRKAAIVETCHARCHDRRHDRRHRSNQSGAARSGYLG